MLRRFVPLLSTLLAGPALAQPNIFDLPHARPVAAIVTRTADPPAAATWENASSPMLLLLDGALASMSAKELDALRRTQAGPSNSTTPGELFAVVHLTGPTKAGATTETKFVQILRLPDGVWAAQDLPPASPAPAKPGKGSATSPAPPRRVLLKSESLMPILAAWSGFRADAGALASPPAPAPDAKPAPRPREVFTLDQPYTPGLVFVDRRVLTERLNGGVSTSLEPTSRDLANESIACRLPSGWAAAGAPGLLIWVDAGPGGRPPPHLFNAADELGLICAGAANSGNDRPVVDRYQLAFDVLATVRARYLVDPDRVYVTGISGGGRVSSMLQVCFSDFFRGAVPIVGMNVYEDTPAGNGMYHRAGFRKPPAPLFELFRKRRMAPITGDKDGNYDDILCAMKVYERDRCQLRLFSYPGMGHEMPTPEHFADALRWVDEPNRMARQAKLAEAAAALKAYLDARAEPGKPAPATDADRTALRRITEIAPWTEPAWQAAKLLRP